MLSRIDASIFDWLTWRSGSILEVFKVKHREKSIVAATQTLRKYAIGYCPSEQVPCRPKVGYVSVMFQTDGRVWWTHLTRKEFDKVFPDAEKL